YLTIPLPIFEDALKYLQNQHYRMIHLDELYGIRQENILKAIRTACLTLDDGYADNWIYIFPLLKKYQIKATIFISPDFIDKKNGVRKNLDDYWNEKVSIGELEHWGYLSWDEIRIMYKSGLVDFQSHTFTHTKYFISDKITGFHHPENDCLYPAGNLFPERKPYYINDPDFINLLPFGYPLFEEKSSVIARKVEINPDFFIDTAGILKSTDWKNISYLFEKCFAKIRPVYEKYKNENRLITHTETEEEYNRRLVHELADSKNIIEKEVGNTVKFCCWPHGDHNDYVHKMAVDLGYLATTKGSKFPVPDSIERLPERIGIGGSRSRYMAKMKFITRLNSEFRRFPFYQLKKLWNSFLA
ncbi:MAG: polysaccharide deacetylase family protein, partial [Bacteroidota bacterium]